MPGVTVTLRDYRDGDLDGAWYAIAATDDPAVNAAVVAEADRRRVFCVRADAAVDGSAVTPATFAQDGLAVGVLAGESTVGPRRSAPRSGRRWPAGWSPRSPSRRPVRRWPAPSPWSAAAPATRS